MIISEFKAWFEGFTECMDGPPNKKQWERIQARVKEIDATATTRTVFIDRYVNPYLPHRYWCDQVYGYGRQFSNMGVSQSGNVAEQQSRSFNADQQSRSFNSHSAMITLGKAEYSNDLSRV